MNLKDIISKEIKIEDFSANEICELIALPPKEDMGDFSLPCFPLAKKLRKSPVEIANQIQASLKENNLFEKVEVVNGFVNFYLNKNLFTQKILDEVNSDLSNYGKENIGNGKVACIEFSSINVAKNPHVGHLCSTLFGEGFARLYENFGFNVKRLNYLGDYGTQFGKVITAFLKWGNKEDVEKRGVNALQELYIKVNKECEDDENLLNECRQTFLKLEQGEKEIKALYDWFVKLSVDEAKRVLYKPLGIDFDDWRGEAYYAKFNKQTLDLLEKKNLVKKDDGALIVDLQEYNLGVVIVQQTSGASLYATRDIGTLLDRHKEYNFDTLIYVTDVRQKQYFEQIFQVGKLLGCDFMDKVYHISYGMLSLPEGKIASRKGAVALIKDLFYTSIQKAKQVLSEKGTISDDVELLSSQIGIGALVFSVLKTTKAKDSVFDINSAINFDGETGPYLQYTFARCASIVRKANLNDDKVDFSLLPQNCWELVKLVQKFPETLFGAFKDFETGYIARFAISLASAFNKYYNENRIITEDENLTKAQVKLTKIVKTLLEKCLYFLVMNAPEKM